MIKLNNPGLDFKILNYMAMLRKSIIIKKIETHKSYLCIAQLEPLLKPAQKSNTLSY